MPTRFFREEPFRFPVQVRRVLRGRHGATHPRAAAREAVPDAKPRRSPTASPASTCARRTCPGTARHESAWTRGHRQERKARKQARSVKRLKVLSRSNPTTARDDGPRPPFPSSPGTAPDGPARRWGVSPPRTSTILYPALINRKHRLNACLDLGAPEIIVTEEAGCCRSRRALSTTAGAAGPSRAPGNRR